MDLACTLCLALFFSGKNNDVLQYLFNSVLKIVNDHIGLPIYVDCSP